MATVTVPPEFFRGELRVYSSWRASFARELLQNATDANPSRIDIALEDVDGHGRVTFSDDGHGMSRDVLENVFFALGKTTKTGADSIGGFGRARIILCFAQARYSIHTGNLIAEGVGGEYTIRTADEHFKGTRLVIDLIDESTASIRYEFQRLLEQSSLKVPVYLDGTRQWPAPMSERATRVLRDELGRAWARVYASPGYGTMRVRVHGLVMFNQWLSGEDHIVLELIPTRSREVLSASRDALVSPYREQLDQFVSDLALNRRAALRPAAAPLETRVGGGGFLATDAVRELTAVPATAASPDESGEREFIRIQPANAAAFENMSLDLQSGSVTLFDDFVEPEPVSQIGFDVFLLADANDARVRRLSRAWDPSSWAGKAPRNRRALLFAWKEAVAQVLDTLMATQPGLGRVLWTVGWTFDEQSRALHKELGDGHVLALNPVDSDGKIAFRLSRREDRQRLLAIATHEVAHVVHADHDESFAAVLTDLFGALDVADADRKIRAAVSAA